MTQLIGAICEGGKEVILVSDRLVSRAGLTFERGTKGKEIADNAMALTTGTAHEPELIEEVKSSFSKVSKPSILSIAKTLTEKYQEIRLARIKDEVLKARGFDSFDEYYNRQKLLHDSLVIELDSQIEGYNLDVHILLAGVDSRAHLYYIYNPGTYSSYDSMGFFCPGMGKEIAESTFVCYKFTPELSASETLYIAFEAKRKAETVGQVGSTTDAWLIDEGGIHAINGQTIEKLGHIYASRQAMPRLGKEIAELQLP